MFKILIAEDDRELRQLFAHVLTKNGYTVLGVSNGEEALAALEQSYYDLIISDIMMPKMDGWQVCREIRSYSKVPIIMLTARSDEKDELQGFDDDAGDREVSDSQRDQNLPIQFEHVVNADTREGPAHPHI